MVGTCSDHWSLLQQVVYVLATELPMVNSCHLLGAEPLLIKRYLLGCMRSRFPSMWHPDEFSLQPNILFLCDYFQHALCPLSRLGTEVIKMSISFRSCTCTLRNTAEYPRRLDSLFVFSRPDHFDTAASTSGFRTFLQKSCSHFC